MVLLLLIQRRYTPIFTDYVACHSILRLAHLRAMRPLYNLRMTRARR